ncbi:putative toxin biosynthesis protein [Xylaria cf. heliscus]|nr:putative toxin biosynthesis protein [Xylaria cf. heliscus]
MESQTCLAEELNNQSRANNISSRPDGSIVPHILLYFFQLVALVSPKFPGRRYVFSGILLGLHVQVQLQPRFTDDIAIAQLFCIQWSFLLATLEKLLLSGDEGPEAHFWRENVGKKEAENYTAFSVRKITWALMLLINQRGIGWNHQVKNVPRLEQIRKSTEVVGDVNSRCITLQYACPGWSFSTLFVFAATPYFALSAQYSLLSFICDWPPMFNPISEATTVRSLWGKYWHQLIRRLWFSFLISGYFHASSHLIIPSPINVPVGETACPIFYFFVLQATAITFEDFVKWIWCKGLGKGEGESKLRSAVGYAWVIGWLWYSIRFPALGLLRSRVGAESPLPFSVTEPWVKYVPIPF